MRLILLGFLISLTAEGVTLKVVVNGIKQAKGKIQLSLDHSADSYLGRTEPLRMATIDARTDQVVFEFTDLNPGTYAIKAFHDENTNSKLDLSLIGIPKEAYGISNNARAALGMPGFDQAKFELIDSKEIQFDVKTHLGF
jgi:uncharacterized protein (DUF2141 family)